MRRQVKSALKRVSSGNPRSMISGTKTLGGLAKFEEDEIEEVIRELISCLRRDEPDTNNATLDALINILKANPQIAPFMLKPISKYLELIADQGASTSPSKYIGRITKSVAIIGLGTNINPKLGAMATRGLAKVLSPPLYRPDRKPQWIKLYSAVIKILGLTARAEPGAVAVAIKPVIRSLCDSYKYSALKENARHQDGLRWQAILVIKELENSAPKLIIPYLIKATAEDNRELRQFLLNSIVTIGREPGIVLPYVVGALTDNIPDVRKNAEYLLSMIAKTYPNKISPYMPKILEHDNREVRLNGIKALASIGESDPDKLQPYLDQLQAWCMDENREIRRLSLEVIGKIGEKSPEFADRLVPFVINALRDKEESVRLSAIGTINSIAENSPEVVEIAIPGLIERTRDPRDHVVWRTKDVLSKLNVDIIEYPRAWRMLDKAKKLLAPLKREGTADQDVLAMERDAVVALHQRDYHRAFDISKNILESLESKHPEQSGGGDAGGKLEKEEEWDVDIAPGEEEKDRGAVPEMKAMQPSEEELPLTQKVSELIDRVTSQRVPPQSVNTEPPEEKPVPPGTGAADHLSELLNRFRQEMDTISLDIEEMDETERRGEEGGSPIPEGKEGEKIADTAPSNEEKGSEGEGGKKRSFCQYCGSSIPGDSKFCNKCGRRLV